MASGPSRTDATRSSRDPRKAQTGAPQPTAGALPVRLLAVQEHDQDTLVLTVHGEIDLGTAPTLREALKPILDGQTGPVVVDLSEVAFMDSTGVHVLVDAFQRLTLEHRRLAIACREGEQVHRVLGLVGLLDTLPVHPSRESAVTGGDLLQPMPRRNRRASAASPQSVSPVNGHAA
jgi:anti-sigma B factor antagonist